jgi:hypothetical protein
MLIIFFTVLIALHSNGYGQESYNFFNLQWTDAGAEIEEAHISDEIKIRFETKGLPEDEIVCIEIWEQTDDKLMDLINVLHGTVKDGIVEIAWVVEFDKDNKDTHYAREIEERGYAIIDYVFLIKYNDVSISSKPLAILGFLYMQAFNEKGGDLARNAAFSIINAENERFLVKSDSGGYMLIRNLRKIRFIENLRFESIIDDGVEIVSSRNSPKRESNANCANCDDVGVDFDLYSVGSPKRDPNTKGVYTPVLYGKIGYSFLMNRNIVCGLDVAIDFAYPWQWEWSHIRHVIGIDYQYIFNVDESMFRLNYMYTVLILFGGGASLSYNINNNDLGIAPQIGVNNYMLLLYPVNCYYRYNIIFGNRHKNYHEIILSLNVWVPVALKPKA